MREFLTVWAGQSLSLIGSEATKFALGVWVYQQTGSILHFALIAVAGSLPQALCAPFAGVLVDRWPRLRVMVGADVLAGLGCLLVLVLIAYGQLAVWHVYALTAGISLANCFQAPAYAVVTCALVPPAALARANGLVQLGHALSRMAAPALAGLLLTSIGMLWVLVVDLASFAVAMVTVGLVHRAIRRATAPAAAGGDATATSFLAQLRDGLRFIVQRRGLAALLISFVIANLIVGPFYVLLTPLILELGDPARLGLLLSAGGAAMFIVGAVVSAHGGPRRQMIGYLASLAFGGLGMILVGIRPNLTLIACGIVLAYGCIPLFLATSRTILQRKTPLALQGRITACYQSALALSFPVAFAVSGPLVAGIFQPLVDRYPQMHALLGGGPARGIGALLVCAGSLVMVLAVLFALYRPLRRVEIDIPDAARTG